MKCITYPNKQLKNINTTIGICGARLSGKDYVADIIKECLNVSKSSLADPIKEQYSELIDISLSDLYTQGETKELHRLGLITLGALRRDQHIDWWCEALHKKFIRSSIIIPDIRFKNEVKYFKKHSNKFILFNVIADKSSLINRGWTASFADKTSTETERLKFKKSITITIDNSDKYNASLKGRIIKLLQQYQLFNI